MRSMLSVWSADIKNIRREPILLILLAVPLLMIALCQYAIPMLEPIVPQVIAYYQISVLFLALMNALFPAFIVAFILLDEKDLQLHEVMKVTPVSISGVLKARLLFLTFLGFVGSVALLLFNGLFIFTLINALMLALLCVLSAPVITLFVSALAKNKVEGLTLLKLANITLFIPFVAYFFQSPWEYLLGIFPAFWIFHFIDPIINPYLVFVIGAIVNLVIILYAFNFAVKRLGSGA